jgi:ABC-type sugar transport system permease subunit
MTPRPGGNGEHERKRRRPVGRVFWTRSRKEAFAAWLFIFPDCIGLLVFVAIPMVLALSLGFFSVDGFGGYKFVGLANYNRMLRCIDLEGDAHRQNRLHQSDVRTYRNFLW